MDEKETRKLAQWNETALDDSWDGFFPRAEETKTPLLRRWIVEMTGWKPLLSLKEAEQIIGCDRWALNTLVEQGELNSFQVGSKIRIPAESLLDYVDAARAALGKESLIILLDRKAVANG